MANHVYNVSEIVGSSPDSVEAAVDNAIAEAAKTLRNIEWFETTSIRGNIQEGKVVDWQVTIKLGFRHESH